MGKKSYTFTRGGTGSAPSPPSIPSMRSKTEPSGGGASYSTPTQSAPPASTESQYTISGKPVSKEEFEQRKALAESKAKAQEEYKERVKTTGSGAVKVMTPEEKKIVSQIVKQETQKEEEQKAIREKVISGMSPAFREKYEEAKQGISKKLEKQIEPTAEAKEDLARRFNEEMQEKRELEKRPFLTRLKEAMKQPFDEKAYQRTSKFMTEPISKFQDIIGGATGTVWMETGRPTGYTGEEIKQAYSKVMEKAIPKKIFSLDPRESALFGLPFIHGTEGIIARFQYGSIEKAGEFRESGEKTLIEQEEEIKQIEKSVKKIIGLPDVELEEESRRYERHRKALEQSVSEFTEKYSGYITEEGVMELPEAEYKVASKEREELEKRRIRLEKIGVEVTRLQDIYKIGIEKEKKRLGTYGITTKETDEGIAFASQALEKKVLPVHIKLKETFLTKEGKPTFKYYAYSVGVLGVEYAKLYAGGFALGTTGVLAKVGKVALKFPKTSKIIGGAMSLGVVGGQAYAGYKYGEQIGTAKTEAVFGALTGISQIVGFGLGGYKGTKLYYQKLESDILKGAYTKGYDVREGKITKTEKGEFIKGEAEQFSRYETRIKGTDMKIETDASLKGIYGKKIGKSRVLAVTEITGEGKKPTVKRIITHAELLESDKFIRMKILSKARADELWLQRDILLKRKFFDIQKGEIIEDFVKYPAEKFTVVNYLKQLGKAERIEFPKKLEFFDEGEIFRYRSWKGQERIFLESEWIEAKPSSVFETKQLTKFGKGQTIIELKVPKGWEGTGSFYERTRIIEPFQAVGKTKGVSIDVLKEIIKGKLILKPKYKIQFKGIDKRGALTLQQLQLESPLEIKKTPPITKYKSSVFELETPLKSLHLLELETTVPEIISAESMKITPFIPIAGSAMLGLKQIVKTKIKTKELRKLKDLQLMKIKQIISQVQIPKQVLRMGVIQEVTPISAIETEKIQTQIPISALITPEITPTITRTITPTITTTVVPIMPIVPVIPYVPKLPFFLFLGEQKKKKRLKERIRQIDLGYSAGFTARTVGITKLVSEQQLRQMMRRIFTGLEIRPQVIVKQRKRRRR